MNKGVRPHVYGRKKKERENRGTGIAWHFIQDLETEDCTEKEPQGRERVPGLCAGRGGEDAACRAKPGPELGELSGSLPSGYSPTTHRSALLARPLACLLSWLVQDQAPSPQPAPPPFFLSTPRCPLSSLTPSEIPLAFSSLYRLSPEAMDDLWMGGKESRIKGEK